MSFLQTCKTTCAVFLTALVLCLGSYEAFSYWPDSDAAPRHVNPPVSQMTPQQRASHMIQYLSEDGKSKALCSGTAIGPHALLTAAHCNDGRNDSKSDTILIALSSHRFHILGVTGDDRDHEIYLIDGPAFTNIAPFSTAGLTPGEHVQYYGFGEGIYPSTMRQGHVRVQDDPSDLDALAKLYTFDFEAIHGDSGSAVFDDHGNIVGIASYVLDWYGNECMGAFALNFAPAKVLIAQHFNPADKTTYPQ